MLHAIARLETCAKDLVNRWWRPGSVLAVVAGLWVNLVIIPLHAGQPVDPSKMGLMFGGLATLFGVRELGKRWGTSQ